VGIYVCIGTRRNQVKDYVVYCLRQYRKVLDYLVVVTDIEPDHEHYDDVHSIADQVVLSGDRTIPWSGSGYKTAVQALGNEFIQKFDELLLFDATFYGPIFPVEEAFETMSERECDIWSMTYFDPSLDKRFRIETTERIMNWSFCVVRSKALRSDAFAAFWAGMPDVNTYLKQFVQNEAAFTLAMCAADLRCAFFADGPQIKTGDPRMFQALKLVRARCPIVQTNIFTVDPIVHDMQAMQSRDVLDEIERTTDYDTGLIWRSMLRHNPLRTLYTNLEQLEIIPDVRAEPEKSTWDFGGKVAVLVHLYYSDMIDEIRPLIDQIPCQFDLLISTSSEQDRKFLLDKLADFDRGELIVRLVEQNRGRDMSSLFITFRDEMLSGNYGLALRLHSKRTPQVSAHMGDWFKDHCLRNLVSSKGYIANLFDIMEKRKDVGVVIPPLIHIAFGTLGHSWFANREPAKSWARELGIEVPFDFATPVAAYGTMYWFRPAALERMFKHDWKWSDYNPEPHHIDGGIAHVQERLICYAAQQDNYRTLTVMNNKMAARNYVALEYKLQLLASRLPSADIRRQYEYIEQANRILGSTFAKTIRVTGSYLTRNANRLYRTIKSTKTRGNGVHMNKTIK